LSQWGGEWWCAVNYLDVSRLTGVAYLPNMVAGKYGIMDYMNTKKILLAAGSALALVVSAARVEVLPQCFDAGGWGLDVQFMDVMGSPYLIAHGRGIRVTDAKAKAVIPEAGEWRVWARSRKWVNGAGAWRMVINGKRLEKVFGVSQGEWAWEDGGTVKLDKGEVAIRLVDQDGFDGRCAGVVLVKDEAAPKGALSSEGQPVAEVVNADLVVVGGGMPGTCAAVAAARRGLKVALVQDRPVLGGNASEEIRVWSGGEARYPLVRELRGWFMNRDANHWISDAHRMRVVEDEPNLEVRLCTRAFGATKQGAKITGVKALDWKNNRVVEFRAPLFCDATGDGWLGFWAGADWHMGREAKNVYNEKSAPEQEDGDTLGASLMWTSTAANTDVPFSAPWAEPWACGETAVNGEWNWEYGIHQDMLKDGEWIRDRLLLAVYGAFSRAKRNPVNSRKVLDFLPFILGKRESRRLRGDWVLNENDFRNCTQFEDAIASTSWAIDLHFDNAKKNVDFLTTCTGDMYGRCWIPYRSIYSRNVENLFMAGRCFSTSHVGSGSPRVINTLSQLGVAVGEASALCRKYGCLPRAIWKDGHVRELQLALGGDFPGHPDPKHANWLIVDDESKGVKFSGKWTRQRWCNGEQYGTFAHVPGKDAGEAVYPLPIAKAGRYELMYTVPYDWVPNPRSTIEVTVVAGGKATKFTYNPTINCGMWNKLGTVDLAPGAVLKLDPVKSSGRVVADAFAVVPCQP